MEGGVRVERVSPHAWYPGFSPATIPIQVEEPTNRARKRFRQVLRTARWGAYEPWGRAALERLLEVQRDRPFDVIWAIHGDDTCHEVAYRFHRKTQTPWVADFKDPWSVFHGRALRPLQRLATSRRLRTANALTETASLQAVLDAKMFGRPTHVVPSGYNATRMANAVPKRISAAPVLLFTGHVAVGAQDEDALCATLAKLRRKFPRLELHAFGRAHDVVERIAREASFAPNFFGHPFVSEEEAFGLMRGADALLMVPMTFRRSSSLIGMKEFEYVASGTPVLYVGRPAPEVAALASEVPNILAPVHDLELVQVMGEIIDAHGSGTACRYRGTVNPACLRKYTWEEAARVLSDTLIAAIG